MAEPITPEALAEARKMAGELYATHDNSRDWYLRRFATLIAHVRAAATAAERERCLSHVLGDVSYDNQQVADRIRRGA